VLLAIFFLLSTLSAAQDLDLAARDLARKIAAAAGRQEATLTVRNSSSLTEAEVARVSGTLETELRGHASQQPGARVAVSVTLSESVHSYLWVAQIGPDVIMTSVPRPLARAVATSQVTLQKKLLWEQDKPILDAAMAGSILLVLDAGGVSFYRDRQLMQSLPVVLPHPAPRDARGRLIVDRESFRAFLPGATCRGNIEPTPSMTCAELPGPWPLDGGSGAELAVGKNYFNEPRLAPFFSTATLAGMRLVASVDGRLRIYDGSLREIGQVNGWGSDIAAPERGCRSDRVALASKPGDVSDADSIQAFDVTPQGSVAVSDPATFPGPVTALWPSARPAEAIAIARNAETGRYAAYSLAITCDR
jgi:hypothetical protein